MDLHDVPAFKSVALRTRLVRLALVAGAIALIVAAAAAARDPKTNEGALVPPDRIGVVVLDLSLSITDDDYVGIRRTLRRLVAEEATIGLVVFSDVPYELLPPGTPATELKPILRLLVAPDLGPINNPWAQTFRAGTRISAALELAKSTLERDAVASGSILLVSDLETAPDDVPALAQTIDGIDRAGIRLRVVPLNPSSDALSLFTGLLEGDAIAGFTSQGPRGEEPQTVASGTQTPLLFLLLGAIVFLLLAAHEGLAGRMALPRTRGPQGGAA